MAHESSWLTQSQKVKVSDKKRICCGEHYPTVAHECGWCQEVVEVGQRVVYVAGMETCSDRRNHDYHEIRLEQGDDPCGREGNSIFAEMTPGAPDDA